MSSKFATNLPLRKLVFLFSGCLAAAFIGCIVVTEIAWQTSLLAQQRSAMAEERELSASGSDDHIPLRLVMNSEGISNPVLIGVDEATVSDGTAVIGIEVEGQSVAYVVDALVDQADHIVNSVINGKPVSVTYCSLVKCTRVLTSPDREGPIPLKLGGLDQQNQMVFMYEGSRYGQSSKKLPLDDHPFEMTSFKKWRESHPTTRVYLGSQDKEAQL